MIKFYRISGICLFIINLIYLVLTKDFITATTGVTLSLVAFNIAEIEEIKREINNENTSGI